MYKEACKIGFTLKYLPRRLEKIECAKTLEDFKKVMQKLNGNALVVIWQMQNILWGKIENGELKLSEDAKNPLYWQEIRIFNEMGEIHLKAKKDKLIGRLLADDDGEEKPFVDTFGRFWGEATNKSGDYIRLADTSRKIFMDIPNVESEELSKYYGLITRNYIDSDKEIGLSGYVDSRFVSIVPWGDK